MTREVSDSTNEMLKNPNVQSSDSCNFLAFYFGFTEKQNINKIYLISLR